MPYQPGGPPLYQAAQRQSLQQAREEYNDEEESTPCARFPHMAVCACDVDCQTAVKEIQLFEVYPGIFMGPFQSAFKTRELIEQGVTHVLNVTCKSYTPRKKYFKYMDVQLHDLPREDAKRHFRATNRFIAECLAEGGKLLVQSVEGKSRAPTFILAYMINNDKMKLRDCLAHLRQYVGEVEPNEGFMSQLAQYDLELL